MLGWPACSDQQTHHVDLFEVHDVSRQTLILSNIHTYMTHELQTYHHVLLCHSIMNFNTFPTEHSFPGRNCCSDYVEQCELGAGPKTSQQPLIPLHGRGELWTCLFLSSHLGMFAQEHSRILELSGRTWTMNDWGLCLFASTHDVWIVKAGGQPASRSCAAQKRLPVTGRSNVRSLDVSPALCPDALSLH